MYDPIPKAKLLLLRERDKETAPSKTEVETMARAGALSRSCIYLCMYVCVSVWSLILFLCVSNPLIKKQKETNVLISLHLQ